MKYKREKKMYLLKELLSKTIEMNASDLHLTVGLPPTVRSNGKLIQLGIDKLVSLIHLILFKE